MGLLEQKVAVVTGASSGIGEATAHALAREGAHVVLAARREDALAAVERSIRSQGGAATSVPTDLTDLDAVTQLVDATVAAHGGIDLLINNAGVADWDNAGVVGSDLWQWHHEMQTNLLAVMSLVHCASTHLRAGGHVVDISSGADRAFAGDAPAYVASKWGLRGFNGSVAMAMRGRAVRVTLIAPGEVSTPMQPDADRAAMRMLDPQDVADAVVFAVTRPRHAVVSEIRLNPSHSG